MEVNGKPIVILIAFDVKATGVLDMRKMDKNK